LSLSWDVLAERHGTPEVACAALIAHKFYVRIGDSRVGSNLARNTLAIRAPEADTAIKLAIAEREISDPTTLSRLAAQKVREID
jgi:hypothetical protein